MQKQQKGNHIECQTCKKQIPQTHISIHRARCNMKKQVIQQAQFLSKSSNISNTRRIRKNKIFQQKRIENQKQSQQKISCPLCGYMQTFLQLDSHPDKCPGKQSICQFCQDYYPSDLMQEHESICEANEHQQQQNERIENNPIQRLLHLIELLNSIGELVRNMKSEEEGLPSQILQSLKKFQYETGKQDQICTICYCKFEKGQECLQLRCKHIYHAQCICKWLQKSCKCPVCKHDQKIKK